MKKFFRFSLLALALTSPLTASAEVHFANMTLAEAEKAAVKQKKTVMIDFYTDWCVWCKVLDRSTYKNGAVGTYADEHFIAIKINAEKEGKDLAKKYEVRGYPTILFLSGDGKVLNAVVGYEDTDAFMRSMNAAAEGGLNGLIAKTTSKTGANDPKAWMTLGDYYAGHHQKAEALDAYDKVIALDPKDIKKYFEQALYGKAFVEDSAAQYALLKEAYGKYPERPEARRAVLALMMDEFNGPNPTDAGKWVDDWSNRHPTDPEAWNEFAWEAAEHNVLLDKAEVYGGRALFQTDDKSDQANILDTRAEVAAKQSNFKAAVIYESEALDILKSMPNDKRISQFTERKDGFQKQADSAGGTQSTEPK
jgi:thioredoxin-related protein